MKIVIKEGTTIENAIKLLSDFLMENYTTFPVLKGNTNIYITLRNNNGQICPDNQQEFHLSDDGIRNETEAEEERAVRDCMMHWKAYLMHMDWKKEQVEKKIQKDLRYFETAEERGRSQENISKRQVEYQKHLEKLEETKKTINFLAELDNAVSENRHTVHITKYTGKTPYTYTLSVVFQFVNVNGYTGYFNGETLRKGKIQERSYY